MADELSYGELVEKIKELEEANKVAGLFKKEVEFILKQIPDVIFRLNEKGVVTFINDAVELYGFKPDEVIGENIFDFVHPEDVDRVKNRLQERRTGDRATKDHEIRMFTKSGKERTFETRAGMPLEHSFLVSAEGMYSKSVPLQKSPDTHLFYQGTHGIGRDVTGYTVEEFHNDNRLWFKIIQPEDETILRGVFQKLIQGKPLREQYRIITKEDRVRWVETRISPVRDDKDALVYFDGIMMEITERKKNEEELREEKETSQRYLDVANVILVAIDKEQKVVSRGILMPGSAMECVLTV